MNPVYEQVDCLLLVACCLLLLRMREIAHAFGVVVPVFTSYIGHKHLSFR